MARPACCGKTRRLTSRRIAPDGLCSSSHLPQLQGSTLTLQPDLDEVKHERDLLWRAKQMELVLEQVV